jgi:hypothetical protein
MELLLHGLLMKETSMKADALMLTRYSGKSARKKKGKGTIISLIRIIL